MPRDDELKKEKSVDHREFARAFSVLSQVAVTIIACVATGIVLGWLLDRWLSTSPWLIIVCTFFGIIAAFKSIFDFAKKQ